MNYDIMIPIKIGLFTLATAVLVMYFLWLVAYIKFNKNNKKMKAYAVFHILVMFIGLLLTGFATGLTK